MQRLKSREQFQAVLAGKTLARTRHFALHCALLSRPDAPRADAITAIVTTATAATPATSATRAPPPHPTAGLALKSLFARHDHWVGALTPKRSAKRAVTRNAIKRQIYTVSPDLILPSPPAAYVVRLSAAFDKTLFPSAASPALKTAVREELRQLFSKAGLLPAPQSGQVTC